MQHTRKQIIEYLNIHHTASVPELSKALSLTLGNIRHHVKELEAQQILEHAGVEPVKGPGRPIFRYQLSPQSMEHNMMPLLAIILKQGTEGLSVSDRTKFFKNIALQMVTQMDQTQRPAHRMQHAIQWLNSYHYHARWEAYATGPRIILGHCPYRILLPEFPGICELDNAILSLLTGLPMVLSTQYLDHPHHLRACFFTPTTKTQSEN